jgi:hypothetical protein
MSLSNTTENAVLKMFLQGTDPSYRGDLTQYVALVTDAGGGASVSEAAPIANECTYTGYARVPITKLTGWTDNGSNFTNATQLQFGVRSDDGATQTATAFVVVDTGPAKATPVNMAIIGDLSADLAINQNIQPQFGIGDLTITAE